ncbi:MAG: histone deacetylase family protein [Ilumatobacteraceae bacterium]
MVILIPSLATPGCVGGRTLADDDGRHQSGSCPPRPAVELEQSGSHPPFEHAGRIVSIESAIRADKRFQTTTAIRAEPSAIEAVHDPGLIRFLESAWTDYQRAYGHTREVVADVFLHARLLDGMAPAAEPEHIGGRLGYWCFETTTPLVEGTYRAARGAVDAAVTAADLVIGGATTAYALCRPPGHHAARSVYGGYCFFNNAAVAAQRFVGAGSGRVAVLDVDYHHGNGTQQIFYERGDVLYVSLHGDPRTAYPYVTGYSDESGSGRGAGANLNLPLPAGTGDDAFLQALHRGLDAITAFGVESLVVSLGLDTYIDDPICDPR